MARSDLLDITVEVVGETDKAWKVDAGFGAEWVPKSQCEVAKNDRGIWTLTCPEWLATEKGFI